MPYIKFVSEEDGQVYLWLLRKVKAGEQICVDYGPEDSLKRTTSPMARRHPHGFVVSSELSREGKSPTQVVRG